MAIIKYNTGIALNFAIKGRKLFLFIIILSSLSINKGLCQNLSSKDSLNVDPVKEHSKSGLFKSRSKEKNTGNVSDSIENSQKSLKTPARASLYSAMLPGLGQTYNGNYWKVPIIYSIFAGIYFLAEENNYKYHEFKNAYKNVKLDQPVDPKFENWSEDELLQYKDYYKRNRDLNIILGGVFYLLNILDANVDANLMDYDINPDLSLKIKPEINSLFVNQNYSNNANFGIKFVLSLH